MISEQAPCQVPDFDDVMQGVWELCKTLTAKEAGGRGQRISLHISVQLSVNH